MEVMMLNKNIDLYFFSGTGNTYIMTKEIEEILLNQYHQVNIFRMEKSDPEKINPNNTIGIGVTAAYFSTYPIVWDFINNLPRVKGTGVFFFSTMGGFSGSLVGCMKKLLKRKGFQTLGVCEFKMPSNLTSKPMDKKELEEKKQNSIRRAENFIRDLHNSNGVWPSHPLRTMFFSGMFKYMNPPAYFRKSQPIAVNADKCTKCGLCAKICPADNITLEGYPKFKDNCQTCMRCFSYCPANALSFKNKNYTQYKAVPLANLLLES